MIIGNGRRNTPTEQPRITIHTKSPEETRVCFPLSARNGEYNRISSADSGAHMIKAAELLLNYGAQFGENVFPDHADQQLGHTESHGCTLPNFQNVICQ